MLCSEVAGTVPHGGTACWRATPGDGMMLSVSPLMEVTAMVRVIDLECDLPLKAADGGAAQGEAAGGTSVGHEPDAVPGYGMANYARIFRTRQEGTEARPPISADEAATILAAAGVERGVLLQASNAITAAAVRSHPERFIGLARMSPHQGMRAVRDLERLIREEGLHGLHLSTFREFLPVSDRRYYPLLTKAAELGVPVRIYSTMSYATDRPYDIGHPRHLDQVCMDFPELTVIAG
ncbi:MAG: amidohydrolase family protein, partial [Dehalococcoidia bacterium]